MWPQGPRAKSLVNSKWLAVVVVVAYVCYQYTVYWPTERADWSDSSKLGEFSEDSDAAWEQRLRLGRIVGSRRYAPAGAASHKFQVLFDDGLLGVAKPLMCLRPMLVWRAILFDPTAHQRYELVDADVVCQGWPDIVGYHLDRAMGFYRKPPTVGRLISNKELYQGAQLFGSDAENTLNWFLWWLPAYRVHCAVQPWLANFDEGPDTWQRFQNARLQRFLVQPAASLADEPLFDQLEQLRLPAEQLYLVLDVSDTLVFDYLMDDHDREAEKNWVAMQVDESAERPCPRLARSSGWPLSCRYTLLLWDSGLAFRHGPLGRQLADGDPSHADPWDEPRDCLTVLRGSNQVRRALHTAAAEAPRHLCRFRAATYRLLKTHANPSQFSVTEELVKRLLADPLHPVFNYGVYNQPDGWWWHRVRFHSQAFISGIQQRAERLVAHIETCIDRYGYDNVVLTDAALLAAASEQRAPYRRDNTDEEER